MTTLRTTVNSFDLFDTLLARRCVDSPGIFRAVESAFGATGFAAARHAAEFQLAERVPAFDIHDIYAHLVASGIVKPEDASRLLAAELDAEFDNAIPIVENLRRVREGDLVVSDMYLPPDVLRRLLQHVGLRVHVHIYVTNLGKHFGQVWRDIAARWIVCHHLGDNPHSDIVSPRQNGIPAAHYDGARPSAQEAFVAEQGFPALSRVMRSLRLRNFFDPGSQENELWLLACQLNLPLLVAIAALARSRREAVGANKLLFSARDCYLLSDIFATLFPDEPSEYIYVSREALAACDSATRDYLADRGLADALVCDIASTGSSWHDFTQRHAVHARLFTLVFIDNWALARVPPDVVTESAHLDFSFALRSSTLRAYTPGIEVLNTAPHGSCLSLQPTGRFFSPRLAEERDFGDDVLVPLLQCHEAALTALRRERRELAGELAARSPQALVAPLVEAISASTLLDNLGKQLLWPPSFGRTTN